MNAEKRAEPLAKFCDCPGRSPTGCILEHLNGGVRPLRRPRRGVVLGRVALNLQQESQDLVCLLFDVREQPLLCQSLFIQKPP